MAEVYGLTFNDVKDDLKTVVANGACSGDDPRVMAAANEATKVLLDWLIPVGGMMTADVVSVGDTITLPPEMENAIEVEIQGNTISGLNDAQIKRGWFNIVNHATYVDPAQTHDNPLVDMFMVRDEDDHHVMRRKYQYPGISDATTVRVTGAKRFVKITGGGDSLIIQNIPALKDAILYGEYKRRGAGSVDDAQKYLKLAVDQLQAEVKKHLLDPMRLAKRKSEYQADLINAQYTEGTLGRTMARIALEVPGFLQRGRMEIRDLINRAVQMLVDNRNQLAIAGRLSVHGSVAEISYAPAFTLKTVLQWTDYNQIRLMIQSFITESGEPQAIQVAEEYQKRAFELQKAQLKEATEKARHSAYTNALDTYVSGTLGWMVARLALDTPNGINFTEAELTRYCSMAEMRIMERGKYKGTLRRISATIHGGEILFPRDVEGIVAASVCGDPLDIRSILFEYQKNGPGHCFSCEGRFVDLGEVYLPQTGTKRRKYNYRGNCERDVEADFVAKVRWVQKEPCEEMVIKNFEAIRLFVEGITEKNNDRFAEGIDVLERELNEYLSGIQHGQNVDTAAFGFAGVGYPL